MPEQRTVTFDENGVPLTESTGAPPAPEPDLEDEVIEDEGEAPAPAAEGRYKIGDRSFATAEEAFDYANSHVTTLEKEQEIADAYRQGIRDAAGNLVPQTNVTPPPPEDDINEEEFYANPKEFLKKFKNDIKTQTQAELRQEQSLAAQGNQIWNEFTSRHPALADFRAETEAFVAQNKADVQGIVATKGQAAGLDYIAMKLKAQFARYAQATKPKRELPNGGGGPSPTNRGTSVTPPAKPQKILSFAEQIRQHKKVK